MAKLTARKNLSRSLIEIRTFDGVRSHRQYLIVRGRLRKGDFFQAFTSVELKEAVLDIQGKANSKKNRKAINSDHVARVIWDGLPAN